MRITQAQQLLKNRNLLGKSLQEISYLAGFVDPAYFSRVFRQETSMSPGEYRRLHSGGG
jgi:AraC-like DNA-binding protein